MKEAIEQLIEAIKLLFTVLYKAMQILNDWMDHAKAKSDEELAKKRTDIN